ncbi:MAG: glyoxylate/hydroxypyruvate reductase A [Proteobacteria bacterium]|nr:glyoxylate/hydroxypyruvate reductase A [Pseudomonadota bacterium]
MSVLLASTVGPADRWIGALREALPGEEFRTDADADNLEDVEIALLAKKAPGLYARLPSLRLIIALQAGIDSLLEDPELPRDIPIARAGRPEGDRMIAEYVLLHVLRHHRNMPYFLANQRAGIWDKPDVLDAGERRVGFLGLGNIAMPCATLVRDVGFQVAAWTRNPKAVPGIDNFHGAEGLAPFLARCEIVVNVLPLTQVTENILSARTFAMLPKGAAVINIGRGQHVVDDDLIAALDSGHLAAATLDVYRTEPLPTKHPFWTHPGITMMPHTARKSRPEHVAPQVADNIRRLRAGDPLLQLVDRSAGY